MSVQESGLTMEGLANRLEALERENERVSLENTELRSKVATLEGSGTLGNEPTERNWLVPLRDGERVSGFEGTVSQRALLSKAGAAAVAAVVAGILLNPREAKAGTVEGTGDPGVNGIGTAVNGVGVGGEMQAGVVGEGVEGFGRGANALLLILA